MTVFLAENQKLNLSAYRTEEQCWVGNVLDAVVGVDPEWFTSGSRVIEVGTGGGFPLLPLAVCFPEVSFTGLDATAKKIDTIGRIVDELGLKNVELLTGRAEELGHDAALREKFDIVLSRALAPLPTLLEYCSPFAKVGGHLLCWKSLDIEDELVASIAARQELNCRLMEKRGYELPGDWGRRQILMFEKTAELGDEYPRATGIPKKEPL